MAPLKISVTALALTFAAPAAAESVVDWQPYIAEASLRFGIPIEWIEHVIRAESNGQTMLNGRPIRSRVGAIGLMHLMPDTWQMLRNMAGLGSDPDAPRDNILAGTLYLRMMYDRFGYPGLFAAYNAGPARFATHLDTGKSLPSETITYVQKVGASASPTRKPSSPGRLFAIEELGSLKAPKPPSETARAPLFVIQNDAH